MLTLLLGLFKLALLSAGIPGGMTPIGNTVVYMSGTLFGDLLCLL